MFNFEHVATSAGWIRGIESQVTEEEEKEAHRHHNHKEDEHQHEEHSHHHHHHHEEGEAEEYGISTLSITAARLSTFTSSTILSLPNGAVILFAPKAYVISAITATCPTSSNKQVLRSN